jgi:hypothetical protein
MTTVTREEYLDRLAKRDLEILEQRKLYLSLRPKVICKSWGLTYSGYMQVLFREQKRKDNENV